MPVPRYLERHYPKDQPDDWNRREASAWCCWRCNRLCDVHAKSCGNTATCVDEPQNKCNMIYNRWMVILGTSFSPKVPTAIALPMPWRWHREEAMKLLDGQEEQEKKEEEGRKVKH
ncbi:hypothetical protein B0T22DRAFT_442773 [Podospora appendiculata]|uniref:Uncharacterized protein n=1 Tax=Podospora appendiculata TaxID=314037 RepID=A0AAE0X6B9_9PEZI|nr:hypothetical protein B0T22DRAFT_442773 [Podospora appendiculata]